MLCRERKLFGQAVVAIDGGNFKAVNNCARNFTPDKMDRLPRDIEESIQQHVDSPDVADREQPVESPGRTEQLQVKIEKIRQKMRALESVRERLHPLSDEQLSLTDPGARAKATHRIKGTAMVGYNVQSAVEPKHHLIVAHEVKNTDSDRAQLKQDGEGRAGRDGHGRSGRGPFLLSMSKNASDRPGTGRPSSGLWNAGAGMAPARFAAARPPPASGAALSRAPELRSSRQPPTRAPR